MHESKYILETPVSYRKDYGQFFTPVSVARLMAAWVMKDGAKTVLDPAFGLGIFYEEIRKINPHTKVQFTGYEIDEHILSYFKLNGSETNLRIINNDYLEADFLKYDGKKDLSSTESKRYDGRFSCSIIDVLATLTAYSTIFFNSRIFPS